MPDHALRFGDVIEWNTGFDVVRWLIVHQMKYGYLAMWLGGDLRPYGELASIGVAHDWEYRLVARDE